MLKNIITFSFFTAISRVSGLVRDVLVAQIIGATSFADIFFSSFRFANLFRAFFAEGAFTTSFIPLYSTESRDNKKAFNFASSVISLTFIILVIFCLTMQTLFPYIVQIFTPGFDQSKLTLTVTLSRIMIPYIIFISIASLIGGMLQVKQHFVSIAIAPIILNLCLIISLFVPYIKTPVHNLSIAVLVGGILQLLLMVFSAYKSKVTFFFSIKLSNEVKLFFKRVIPAIVNNCVTQISLWFDTIMASFIPNAISYIYYADRINQLPRGVIGITIGVVLLPLISKQVSDTKNMIRIQNSALNAGLMLIMPVTAAFIIVPHIILLTLFSYSKFNHYAMQQIASTLTAFSFSLPAFIINKVLLITFFVKGDFKIPTIFSLICLGINVVLNLLLIGKYQHVGIAIATSISTWVNSILLIYYLIINKMYKISQVLLLNIVKIIVATLIMSIALYISSSLLAGLSFDKAFVCIIHLAALVALGVVIYFGTLMFMDDFKYMKL
ncbi:murein biosynthesis integral membrane protein MurJ [Wolbachia endosymbiont of Dirofilaria (Dirofilaria) immitis]|uniref:murein biosynthesis integral membrane protein MurJ n=1 Tax=Wolbachia endosymbiont of Dirofilaria (Dirofilaria) immitis TaxID=1812115 RepID=UPI001589AE11|nr:murein biosynthesis integral membrane protein MurJ [Wolbachia endosymbiont of Dirofilaria (Dirofilaria) immitis]QKX02479.1 murein biosynthesis integral membrane protein MurJ [Wolbachia endosymbiont of Dirofilaria (Dirofilaria) immitis]